MALMGYSVTISNIFEYDMLKSDIYDDIQDAREYAKRRMQENTDGDVIIVWFEYTEENPTICEDYFKSPETGWQYRNVTGYYEHI